MVCDVQFVRNMSDKNNIIRTLPKALQAPLLHEYCTIYSKALHKLIDNFFLTRLLQTKVVDGIGTI